MTPHIVVFDLGKVLVDFDYRIAARRFAARSDRSPEEIQALIDHSALLYQFETGLLTDEGFYREVAKVTGFCGDFAEFTAIFADIFCPIPAMVEWQERLRRAGVPTYIFSNTNGLAVSHIRRCFPFFAHFDGYILSYQLGVMKPASGIYEALERMSGRKGAEILYLDDRLENAEGGQARGWQVILHESAEKTLELTRSMFELK